MYDKILNASSCAINQSINQSFILTRYVEELKKLVQNTNEYHKIYNNYSYVIILFYFKNNSINILKLSNKNKYKKLKPTKSHILKTRQENYKTSYKKLQSCTIKHVLKNYIRAIYF